MKKSFLIAIIFTINSDNVDGMQLKKNIIKNKKLLNPSIAQMHTSTPVKSNMVEKKQNNLFAKSEDSAFFQAKKIEQFKNILKNKKTAFLSDHKYPSIGYFQEKLKPRYYSTKPPQKNVDEDIKKEIVLEDKDPQVYDKVLEFIKTWKPLQRKNPKNGFFEADDPKKRDNRRNKEEDATYWQWFKKLWWTALIVPAVDTFWPKKDKLVSEKPFDPVQAPAYYPENVYKYALDGDLAQNMSASDFIKVLQQHGLTVADAIKIQCQIQEEAAYQELTALAKLTDHDWALLQNILKLRHDFLKGHYNENNITFDGDFSLEIQKLVKDALQKADVPFKVRVHANSERGISTDLAANRCGISSDVSFKYHLQTSSAGIVGGNLDIELYLSNSILYPYAAGLGALREPDFYQYQPENDQKAIIAHEVAHIVNLHSLQSFFAFTYLKKIKKVDSYILKKCINILRKIYEYQADVLAIAYGLEEAKAQMYFFKLNLNAGTKTKRPDIYISHQKGYELASRAVRLYEAESDSYKGDF